MRVDQPQTLDHQHARRPARPSASATRRSAFANRVPSSGSDVLALADEIAGEASKAGGCRSDRRRGENGAEPCRRVMRCSLEAARAPGGGS